MRPSTNRDFPKLEWGVIAEDFDEDGDWDLFVTHLGNETNTLYLNDEGLFFDSTDALGLGAVKPGIHRLRRRTLRLRRRRPARPYGCQRPRQSR